MPKFKIVIEYDGTNFIGWQKQSNGPSIQEKIEKAIYQLTGDRTSLYGAGRTDAGVHAKGQVAHFDIKKKFNINNIRDGLNQYLKPYPIGILKAIKVDDDFNARFFAKKRTYKYFIINRRTPLTLDKDRSWGVFKKLDIEKIIYESKFFLGKHNMKAFRSVDCQSKSTIKTIDEIIIQEKDERISIEVSARSFLHSQVRIMVGTLVEIGKGKIKKSIKKIIESEDRSQAGITAPACGLYLIKVDY